MLKKKDTATPTTESELIDQYIAGLAEKEKQNRTKKYRPRYQRRPRFLLPTAIILSGVLAILVGLIALKVLPLPDLSGVLTLFDKAATQETASIPETDVTDPTRSDAMATESAPAGGEAEQNNTAASRPSKLFAAQITTEDLNYSDAAGPTKLVEDAVKRGLTSLFLKLNHETGLITGQPETATALEQVGAAAHQKAIALYGVVDLTSLIGEGDLADPAKADLVKQQLLSLAEVKNLDGLMLTGIKRSPAETDFHTYMLTGTPYGYKQYSEDTLTAMLTSLSGELRRKNGAMLLGLICDSVYTTADTASDGMKVKTEHEMLRDDHADVLGWMEQQIFDIVFVTADTTTSSKTMPFATLVNWWSKHTPPACDLGFLLSSDAALEGKGGWRNPDQLTRQLMTLNDSNRYVFCFNSFSALAKDTTGGSDLVAKYLNGDVAEDYVLRELGFTSPTKRTFTTYENSVAIIGASDPNFDLLLNGKEVERTEYGYFSLQLDLKVGKNTFTFTHKGSSETFTITYRYVVLKDYSPSSAVKLNGGDSLIVKATARTGSTVKASLAGQTVALNPVETEEYSDFTTYSGSLTMPTAKTKAQDLGKIKFTGTHNGVKESFSGGSVTIKKKEIVSSEPPPTSGGYIGVGNTLIAEVTKYSAETFNGENAADDLSLATNNYLPAGTIDYCAEKTDYDPSSGNSYRLMRYGKRIYTSDVRTLRGSLPKTNQLSAKSIVTTGSHTVMTLKNDWKAPFKLQILPQKYTGGSGKYRTTITSRTFTYIDLTFCYASELDIDTAALAESPIFSKAQIIKNTADYTLRLYLQKAGEFYGWTSEYDSEGNLVFRFTNPVRATKTSNEYGGRLDGIKIVVDAGHGGSDGGAQGSNKKYDEAERNLYLANKVAAKLESIGATVVMTRTSDTGMSNDTRIKKVKNAKANLAISIHRDSATNTSANGYSTFYFNPYTHQAAECINNRMKKAKVYDTIREMRGHVFFLSRISDCPVVLTENGFMSNSSDYNNIILKDKQNEKCADAIVKGIVDYFLTIG